MLRRFLLILVSVIFFFLPALVSAQESEVNLYFFWSKSCPHCAEEKVFLQKIVPDYPDLKIHDFEVSERSNALLLKKIGEELNIETNGVPITVIGESYFVGYLSDATTGQIMIQLIEKTASVGDPDPVGRLIRGEPGPTARPQPLTPIPTLGPREELTTSVEVGNIPESIKLPVLGDFKIKNLSLPVLTIVIAVLDGFNPCAMWTLLFLISLLLGMQDRKRMWILGSAFIFTSGLVYFLFLSAWLNLFLFIGLITWVRVAIGLVALGGGSYYLYDFVKNKSGGCEVIGDERRQQVFERLKGITQRKEFLLALGGIVILAFAVNLIELVCSAGLPAVYTQVLTLSKLTTWQYFLYLLLYIFVFMLDDLFIFVTAMITLQATGIQSKYSRFSRLIGGILMIIIGILLLFKPELLMFG
jgi:glutaredoxin